MATRNEMNAKKNTPARELFGLARAQTKELYPPVPSDVRGWAYILDEAAKGGTDPYIHYALNIGFADKAAHSFPEHLKTEAAKADHHRLQRAMIYEASANQSVTVSEDIDLETILQNMRETNAKQREALETAWQIHKPFIAPD